MVPIDNRSMYTPRVRILRGSVDAPLPRDFPLLSATHAARCVAASPASGSLFCPDTVAFDNPTKASGPEISMRMFPSLGEHNPHTNCKKVLFPEPLFPTKANGPGPSSTSLVSCNATLLRWDSNHLRLAYVLATPSARINAGGSTRGQSFEFFRE